MKFLARASPLAAQTALRSPVLDAERESSQHTGDARASGPARNRGLPRDRGSGKEIFAPEARESLGKGSGKVIFTPEAWSRLGPEPQARSRASVCCEGGCEELQEANTMGTPEGLGWCWEVSGGAL